VVRPNRESPWHRLSLGGAAHYVDGMSETDYEQMVTKLLARCIKAQHVTIGRCYPNHPGAAGVIGQLTQLTSLRITRAYVEQWEGLCEALSQLRGLTELTYRFERNGRATTRRLLDLNKITTLTSLRLLDLRNIVLGSMPDLAALASMPHLQSLNLRETVCESNTATQGQVGGWVGGTNHCWNHRQGCSWCSHPR
jgi:hypothetical protein